MATAKQYPFKFLDAYTRKDAAFFFGRDEEIAALYDMVFQTDLILVYGASGTGKTSLIQCGLANKFQPYDWLALNVRRGKDLNESLNQALRVAGGDGSTGDALDWLDEWEGDAPAPAAACPAAEALSPVAQRLKALYLHHFKPLYLIFDQFEELYILGTKAEQRQFIATVRDILRVEQPVKVILSIREEYLGHLYEFERAVPELLRKKLRVEPMDLERVKTVLLGVSSQPDSNVQLEAGHEVALAEGIFEKIRGQDKTLHIPLPYLQVFLDKFYLQVTGDESRQAEATFTRPALAGMGDLGDVLRNFLDEQATAISHAQSLPEAEVWRALSPFVTLEGTKEPLSEAQLAARLTNLPAGKPARLLQALVKGRILRFSEASQLYEIAHDALAKQIHAKRSDEEIAILEVQRLVKSQTAMKAEAREYFTEKQLLFMEPYLEKLVLGEAERAWIEESRVRVQRQKEESQRRQEAKLRDTRRRLWVVRGLLALALVAVVVAGYLGILANKALENLQDIADQAIPIILADIDQNIYRLEYDSTYGKFETVIGLKARQSEVKQRICEIAYFYTEADTAAAAVAFLNLLQPTGLTADTPGLQDKLRAYFASTLPSDYLAALQERYYPKMLPVEEGAFWQKTDAESGELVDSTLISVKPFHIGETEITYWQYNVFARAEKHYIEPPAWEFCGDNPVAYINWYDAAFYCNWLSKRHGKDAVYTLTNPKQGLGGVVYDVKIDTAAKGYRLPTEAEWEFAARGGNYTMEYEYSGDSLLTNVAWYLENSNNRTRAVKLKNPNELGLYDMSGNVWEWCADWYEEGKSRVICGGSWLEIADYCRTECCRGFDLVERNPDCGFRLVLVP